MRRRGAQPSFGSHIHKLDRNLRWRLDQRRGRFFNQRIFALIPIGEADGCTELGLGDVLEFLQVLAGRRDLA